MWDMTFTVWAYVCVSVCVCMCACLCVGLCLYVWWPALERCVNILHLGSSRSPPWGQLDTTSCITIIWRHIDIALVHKCIAGVAQVNRLSGTSFLIMTLKRDNLIILCFLALCICDTSEVISKIPINRGFITRNRIKWVRKIYMFNYASFSCSSTQPEMRGYEASKATVFPRSEIPYSE